MRTYFILFLCFVSMIALSGQQDLDPSKLGHEWMKEGQLYFKVGITEEGVYRIGYDQLLAAGIPVDELKGSQIELFSYGKRERIRVSSNDRLSPSDYVEWYGTANDGTVDALIYDHPSDEQLNPAVSLYTTERPYYLTWTDGPFSLQYYKYQPNASSQNNPLQEKYYMHREVMVFDTFHYKPTHDGRNFIRYSSMDIGEGYGTKLAGERNVTIPVDHLSSVGINPVLKMRFGTNALSRAWRISVNDRAVATATTNGYDVVTIDTELKLDDISNGTVDVTISPLNDNNEKHTLASIELIYPRTYSFDATSYLHYLQHPSLLGRKISIPDYAHSAPIAYNLQAGYYLYPSITEGTLSMIIPQTSNTEDWVIVDQEQGIKSVASLQRIEARKEVSAMDYLILSTTSLIESGAVADYAAYRESPEGGGYHVSIQDVNVLYDRYSYGVWHHPLAIKNYIQDLRSQGMLPKFIFILGKGREYDEIRFEDEIDIVPTFGVPGSDNLLIAPRGQRFPDVAIGRLAVESPDQIKTYLSKIKDHELAQPGEQTISDQGWKKRILHLSGGSADIQESIFRFLNDMSGVIESNRFAADVFTFRKRSADPIKAASSEAIVSRINEGASILTFFGHSAVGTFDFSLEDPSKYNNKGRNPVILSLGCHSGNIHTSSPGISEEFVLEPENGAIAFIASAGTAYAEPQYLSGLYFYELLGEEMYGMSIGQVLQSSLELRGDSESLAVQTLIEQMTLHGDPAYHYQTFDGPDYVIDGTSVEVAPAIINTTSPYITINFDVVNLGALQDELVDVSIIHVLPDGRHQDTIITTLSALGYKTKVSLDIDNPGGVGIGENRVLIRIDPSQKVAESPSQKSKSNNNYIDTEGVEGLSFYIFDNSAKPVYPSNFGIVGDEEVTLKASLSNGLISSGSYIIELDTTQLFDSPSLIQKTVEATSSLIEWSPAVDWKEEEVYYWRVAPLITDGPLKANQWRQSSFVYLHDQGPGWNQSHYYQQLDNQFTSLTLDAESRRLGYIERTWDVRIKNELRQEQDFWVFVNNTPWASLNPKILAPGIAIFIWDPRSVIFNNNGTDYGSLAFSKDVFIYKMDKLRDRRNIIQLLEDAPDGARVFMHTILADASSDLHVEDWLSDSTVLGTTLYDVLEGYGATKVRELAKRGTVPYTFVFDKGGAAVVEDIANNIEEVIDISAKAKTNWDHGNVTSINIGPAKQWQQLRWKETKDQEDLTSLTVYGIGVTGQEKELMVATDNYEIDLSQISSTEYPYLRLSYDTRDDKSKTSANLDHWRVLYDVLPDAAIYSDMSSLSIADTIDAGAILDINYTLRNLSPAGMDPMLVKYALIDQATGKSVRTLAKRSKKLPGDSSIAVNQIMMTDQLAGDYQLIIEVNPQLIIPEQTDCNNFGFKQVYIRPDERNPILDVTVDNKRIRNGDIVAERPEIVITLDDPGAYLLLDDPEDFDITLYYPQVFVWQPEITDSGVSWQPATDLADNKARFVLTPNLGLEGIYTLEVNAKDKAGNWSGDQHYRVTFEVRDDDVPVILSVGPNPTSDYVIFDYNLTTDRIPRVFDLFIYSTDGRLVAHADKEDFGGLRKGVNTYRWNATNGSGELLPSGLYFYEILNSFDSRKDKVKGSIFVLRP